MASTVQPGYELVWVEPSARTSRRDSETPEANWLSGQASRVRFAVRQVDPARVLRENTHRLAKESAFFARFRIDPETSLPVSTLESITALATAGFLSGSGMLALVNETALMQATRPFMDSNSGPLQVMMKSLLGVPDGVRAVGPYMDQMPGVPYVGGFGHRIVHGHDLQGLILVFDKYGLSGGAEWLNHVFLRDAWTPAGIPILPFGSAEVYAWLKSFGVAPGVAADVLALNAAEFLGGLGLVAGVLGLGRLAHTMYREAQARESARIAERDASAGNFESARKATDTMLALSGDASSYLHAAKIMIDGAHQRPETERAFGSSAFHYASWILRNPETSRSSISLDGLELGLRGVAASFYTMATRHAIEAGQGERDDSLIESAALSLLDMARLQRGFSPLSPRRKLASALANEILAFELTRSLHPSRRIAALNLDNQRRQIGRGLQDDAFAEVRVGFHALYPTGGAAPAAMH